jgi:hypothetical protein
VNSKANTTLIEAGFELKGGCPNPYLKNSITFIKTLK